MEGEPHDGPAGPGGWRNIYLLVAGNAVSTLGSSLYLIVVVLLLKDLTDSGLLLGLYQFLALLPAALLMPLTGSVIDRLPRRSIVIGSDLFRGVLMLLLAAAWLVGPLSSPITLLFVSFFIGLGNALFVPAAQALIPELAPDNRLEEANGLRATTNQLSNLAGNALGGLAYAFLAAPFLFLVNGVSFLLSALQELLIEVPDESNRKRPGEAPELGVLAASREGLALVAANGELRRRILSQVALFFISPPVVLSLPFLVEDRLGRPDWLVGLLFATMLGGAIVAFLLLSRRRGRGGSLLPLAYTLLAAALLAVPPFLNLSTLFVAAAAAGAAAGTVYIEVSSEIQRRFPREFHGRLFAIVEAGNALIAPMAYLLSGALIDLLSPRVELIYLFAALPTLVWGAILWVARLRSLQPRRRSD